MASGSLGYRKTVRKSEYWHRHGKHRPVFDWLLEHDRTRIARPREPMYDSVREAFAATRRKAR